MRSSLPISGVHIDRRTWRTAAWLSLVLFEVLAISFLFDFETNLPRYRNPVFYALMLVRWAAIAAAVLAIVGWAHRLEARAMWQAAQDHHDPWRPLFLNVAMFLALAASSAALSWYSATSRATPPWLLLTAYGALLVATTVSLLRVDVPLAALAAIVKRFRRELAISAALAVPTVVLSTAAQSIWLHMSGATLAVTSALLRLYEPNVVIDEVERAITVGNFKVVIDQACSGYEGLVLVAVFVSVYLTVFRSTLRFPQALLLYPIGLSAIWLLNAVRIALLTSLGAHVSPRMAASGFHSQAGWIAFLAVSLGLMALAPKLGFGRRQEAMAARRIAGGDGRVSDRTMLGSLLPFTALMLASIVMAAAAPFDTPLYVLKVVAVASVLLVLRDNYGPWAWRLSGSAVLAGVVVGAAWIATAPAAHDKPQLSIWLAEISPAAASVWLVARGIGTIVLVPIAEELAFRGFLYRWIISRRFDAVPITQWSLLALIVSSLLFGLLHDRWIAGALAGAVFALVMLRNGNLRDAIAAHATANALIFGWAVTFRQWSLL